MSCRWTEVWSHDGPGGAGNTARLPEEGAPLGVNLKLPACLLMAPTEAVGMQGRGWQGQPQFSGWNTSSKALASPCLHFLVCKLGIIIAPT